MEEFCGSVPEPACTFSLSLPDTLVLLPGLPRMTLVSIGLSLWNLLRTGQLLSSPASSRLKGGGKGLRLAPWRWGAPSLGLPRLLSWSKPEKPVSS